MDIKYVLSSVLREAEKLGSYGELLAGVRLSGAVNSERGEGYFLLYSGGLSLLYRRLGERDYEGVFSELPEWNFSNYNEEKYALTVNMECANKSYICEFTPSERESAEMIFNAINTAHAEPHSVYTQTTLTMAGLICLLSSDGHESYAENLLGKRLYRAGIRFVADRTLPALVADGNTLFSVEQKQSILANLIEQRMSDDIWSSAESSALRELSEVWQLGNDFYEQCVSILLLRRKLGLLFQN